MKARLFLTMAAAALVLASCSKDDNETIDNWNGEIRLSSGVSVQTRANNGDVPDKQIASGQTASFFVDDAGIGAPLYENYLLTANGNGGFTKFNPQGLDMYYPTTGNDVDIYALLTDGFVGSTAFPTSAITHQVKSDQSEQYGDNYLSSDLLYAANKGVTRTKQTVLMNFYHMLSKVDVALKVGAGAPDLTGAVVTIENTQLKADFLPVKSENINDAVDGQGIRASMIVLTAAENAIAPITIGTAVSPDFSAYASAVVVPQTMSKGSRFIKVTLASGGELYYTIPNEDGLQLKSGYKYQYQITVNLTGLTVKSTIFDWATGVIIEGTAEMPIPKDLADAAVGDFYMSDGTIEDKDATLTAEQQAACIGIVFKVGKDDSGDWKDDCDYKLKDGTTPMSTIHGYVLALYDANNGSECTWGSYGTQVNHSDMNREENIGFYGYKNTNAIKEFARLNSKTLQTDFPATYYAAVDYETRENGKYAAPANSSGWFLPSAGQGKYWLNNTDVLLASAKRATNDPGYNWENLYWSSSEYDNNPAVNAWIVAFFGDIGYDYKYSSNYVRSVLAF